MDRAKSASSATAAEGAQTLYALVDDELSPAYYIAFNADKLQGHSVSARLQ